MTNWNNFAPTDATKATIKHGISTGGSVTGSPFLGDNATFYGYVEGFPAYYTQHLTVQYATTEKNKNRYFVRTNINGTFSRWRELNEFYGTYQMAASDNVTDPNMVGSYFTQDTVITSGLPTTGTGKYYELLAGKGAQFAMRHATDGIDKMFVRHYINDKWYPWMEVAMYEEVNMRRTQSLNGTVVTTDDYIRQLPAGAYMVNGSGTYLPISYGTIFVVRTGGAYGFAMAVGTESGSVYTRHFYNNGWHNSSWIQIH